MSQQGKVALVTGGAQGIGRAFVEHLLAEGASVSICDFNKTVGDATAKALGSKYPGKVVFFQCDVTNDQQLESCFKGTVDKFSRLDIVVNNAGIGNERDWRKTIDVNFEAVVVGTKLGLKYMGKNSGGRGGTVINIASVTCLEAFPSLPVYSATKAAVNQFSRSMGDDLYYKKSGVKVVSINPGMTDTPLTAEAIPHAGVSDDPEVVAHWDKHFNSFHLQKPDNMGRGLIEVLKKGANGSLWTVDKDEPAKPTIVK